MGSPRGLRGVSAGSPRGLRVVFWGSPWGLRGSPGVSAGSPQRPPGVSAQPSSSQSRVFCNVSQRPPGVSVPETCAHAEPQKRTDCLFLKLKNETEGDGGGRRRCETVPPSVISKILRPRWLSAAPHPSHTTRRLKRHWRMVETFRRALYPPGRTEKFSTIGSLVVHVLCRRRIWTLAQLIWARAFVFADCGLCLPPQCSSPSLFTHEGWTPSRLQRRGSCASS